MVILYTTGCPKCRILETKLGRKNVKYVKCEDTKIMKEKGMTSVPYLEVNGIMLNFEQANSWINSWIDGAE